MNYRKLTSEEIKKLSTQGCMADNWAAIDVSLDFNATHLHNVKFTGVNCLGAFDKIIALGGNEIAVPSGLANVWLHNCVIGNNVYIRNVGQYIANYEIENEVILIDCGIIETVGETTFGNGIKANVISESGNHPVFLFNELSAQLAYMLAKNNRNASFINRIETLVEKYSSQLKSTKGLIKSGAKISGCKTIRNVFVGENAHLENVVYLENGSICSVAEAPVYIGNGCSCADFIIQSGASLNNGVLLSHCLIGQGGVFDKQFSAEHSAFFANCQGSHSEVCSVFAGPYTVTHHKSTLLIAALFSFMNAGSGSNQSNHAYKTGPIHYGFTDRGLKLASNSYLFWPAQIGAFTMVSGRHYNHPDTRDFPFSFLIEKDGKSHLLPGINFSTVGTWRDEQKWPQRDKRVGVLIDKIHFNLLNPYIVAKMQRAKEVLNSAKSIFGKVFVDEAAKRRGIEFYDFAEDIFLLEHLVRRGNKLQVTSSNGRGEWVDMAGMLCPVADLEALTIAIIDEKINSLEEIAHTFDKLYLAYSDNVWVWVTNAFEKKYGKRPEQLSPDELAGYASRYEELFAKHLRLIESDTRKEQKYYQENDNG